MTVINWMLLPAPVEALVSDEADEPIVLSVCGDLDASSAADLRAALRSVVGARSVILDLSEVRFVDSAGIGVLIGGIRRVHEGSGRVVVIARPGPVFGLLDRVGVSRLAPVLTTFADAKAIPVSHAENDRGGFGMVSHTVVKR